MLEFRVAGVHVATASSFAPPPGRAFYPTGRYTGGMTRQTSALLISLVVAAFCACRPAEPTEKPPSPAAAAPSSPAPVAAAPAPEKPAATQAAPEPWYEPEIRAFEEADAASPPAPGQVLFIGSSSIRMWKSLAEDMKLVPVLNRGFGGSKTPEVLAVFERIVTPYKPCVIVYYCGDNDLGTDNTDSRAAADGFLAFDRRARTLWPNVQVFYIAIKPSLARWSNWAAMERANAIVHEYCDETAGATFLDTATPTLTDEGKPDPTIFLKDGLHLNEQGYAIWTGIIKPAVLKAWDASRQ